MSGTSAPSTWSFPSREDFDTAVAQDAAGLYEALRHYVQQLEQQIETLQDEDQQAQINLGTVNIQLTNALNQVEEQRQTLEEGSNLVRRLRQERNEARQANRAASAPPPPPSPTPPPPPAPSAPTVRSEKMPDPEKFDGTRSKLPGFVLQLRSKLSINRDRFVDENNMILYTINRLEGAALEQVRHTVLPTGLTTWNNAAELIAHLEAAFGDPDPMGTARRELHNLKQGKRDFSAYMADFQRIMGQLNYDENSKIDALTFAMSEELKEAMVLVASPPTTFNALATFLTTLDNRMRARREEKRGSARNNMGQFSAPAAFPAAFTPASSFTPGGLAPMDLSFGRTSNMSRPAQDQRYTVINGRRKLSEEEKQWRRSTGKCMFCAAPDHSYANCPSAPKKPTMRGALTSAPAASSSRLLPPPPPPQFPAFDAEDSSSESLN